MPRNLNYQRGAALFTALMFLVILTLISITAMRTSTMELQMANNEQWQRFGADSAESATEVVVNSTNIVIGNVGDISCFSFIDGTSAPTSTEAGATCTDATDMGTRAGVNEDNVVEVTMGNTGNCPPSVATSARGSNSLRTSGNNANGTCVFFSVDSYYDATAKRGGRTETREGFIRFTN